MNNYSRLEAFRPEFEAAGNATGICPCLLGGIAWNESGGNRFAVNPDSIASGLMQIHPVHFDSLGWQAPTSVNRTTRTGSGGFGWYDSAENIRAGADILRLYLNRTGDIRQALRRYVGASTDERARPYIDKVMTVTIDLAHKLKVSGRWQ